MKKRWVLVFALIVALMVGIIILIKGVGGQKVPIDGSVIVVNKGLHETEIESAEKAKDVEYTIEPFVSNLFVPWSIVFTSNDRILVTERNGQVREVIDGILNPNPIKVFTEVSNESEGGLMGMALDPNYEENKLIYFCLAYPQNEKIVDKVVKVFDRGSYMNGDVIILDDIPAARFHAGCRLKFGPDEKLYITTGDATDKDIAQDLTSLGGKILRINVDGSIPSDNPFVDSPVWSYGHRNSQGIDWHVSGVMWSSEHGPSGGDEINVIQKGANYGWPIVSHENNEDGLEAPKLVFTPSFPPGSAMFYTGNAFPQFANNLFVGGLKSEGILRIIVSMEDPSEVISYQRLPGINFGRIREIAQGPDGDIYFTTSNRDGRLDLRPGDDKIYRIYPQSDSISK